jgi:hypothetical protein
MKRTTVARKMRFQRLFITPLPSIATTIPLIFPLIPVFCSYRSNHELNECHCVLQLVKSETLWIKSDRKLQRQAARSDSVNFFYSSISLVRSIWILRIYFQRLLLGMMSFLMITFNSKLIQCSMQTYWVE